MKILVTGAAGFIGSHVVDAYIAAGHDVVVIDDLSTGSKRNLNSKAKFYEADIRNLAKITEIFQIEKPEVVNHHAAFVSVTESEKAETMEINFTGTKNVVCQPGIKRFIFASTGGAMFNDPKRFPPDEQEPENPASMYGKSKQHAEQLVKEYAASKKIPYVILRYSNVFGPRQNAHGESGVVAIFCNLAGTGGTPNIYGKDTTRDYVYVGDVAKANVVALTTGEGTYNIATGIETTNQQVFETIAQAFSWKATPNYQPLRPGEVTRSALDASKAQRELGWKPRINFEQGVRLIHDYKN